MISHQSLEPFLLTNGCSSKRTELRFDIKDPLWKNILLRQFSSSERELAFMRNSIWLNSLPKSAEYSTKTTKIF